MNTNLNSNNVTKTSNLKTITVDSIPVTLGDESNLLEVIRKAGIELPTFCYHSDLSVYGACRMCMVEIEDRHPGIFPACSTKAEPGMVIRTNTKTIRDMRKMIIELMLASSDHSCTTCPKSGACKLQDIATQLGVKDVRFKQMVAQDEKDLSSPCIARDPAKCILCGDCVRVCDEIQSVGSLDFAYRGADARVVTCGNKGIGEVECVGCGQCVKVCPVGALTIKTNLTDVWNEVHNKDKIVVATVAPAVRVAIGECFGEEAGINNIGKIVSALRIMGFDRVFDLNFAADLTTVEEGNEFIQRYTEQKNLPQFTSCCPAWVKFAEEYYPNLLNNLSTVRSPMSLFGSVCKEQLSKELGVSRDKIVIVMVGPCTAKKFEANRPEFAVDGNPDIDHVITTEELARMIKEHGIEFEKLGFSALDMPLSFATGGAIIFGSTGGVCESVLRYAAKELEPGPSREFKQFRGKSGTKIGEIEIGGNTLRLAVVSGLANARALIDRVQNGEESFDLIEVMACPGGCVNGAGQPTPQCDEDNSKRAKGLYDNDRMLPFHSSGENPVVKKLYDEDFDEHKIHELLHTKYGNRRLIKEDDFVLSTPTAETKLNLTICFGRSCFTKGAQALYGNLMKYIRDNGLEANTEFKARFCATKCGKGPVLLVNDQLIEHCTLEKAVEAIGVVLPQ
ncbi:MAG: [FeFe] hydrogenase, group A [Oscillospiraceae bacterium]|nr:[FeFe] hydrogenase, group A [Oscillospiraceae bacterium]